jgi:hypothetical protein
VRKVQVAVDFLKAPRSAPSANPAETCEGTNTRRLAPHAADGIRALGRAARSRRGSSQLRLKQEAHAALRRQRTQPFITRPSGQARESVSVR